MKLNKFYLLLVFLVTLIALYAFSIFSTNKLTSSLADNSPVNLSFTMIVPSKTQCVGCFDPNLVINSIKTSFHIEVSNKKIITPKNLIFKNLIKRYKIKNLPAVIISGDISNIHIVDAWLSMKGVKEDGNIVIQNLLPFYDIASQKPRGIVHAVLLKDKTCKTCFDESQYLAATKRIGITVESSVVYDVASSKGAALVKKYHITKVPTLLLSPEIQDYNGFISIWKKVGTVEKDGWLVFREVQKMGKYENIKSKP